MFDQTALEAATQKFVAEMKEAHEENRRHQRRMTVVRSCALAATFAVGFLSAR